jgi:hypothetical protein
VGRQEKGAVSLSDTISACDIMNCKGMREEKRGQEKGAVSLSNTISTCHRMNYNTVREKKRREEGRQG